MAKKKKNEFINPPVTAPPMKQTATYMPPVPETAIKPPYTPFSQFPPFPKIESNVKPKQKPLTEEKKIGIPQIIRTADTGAPGGIITPQGDTLLLSPERTRQYAEIYAKQQAPIAGTQEASKVGQQKALAEQQQGLIGKIGQQQTISEPMGVTPLNYNQVVASTMANPSVLRSAAYGGLAVYGAGVLGSAAAGATAGTALTPGVGTAIGAGVGLALGIYSSIMQNIKKQKTDSIASQKIVLSKGSTQLNQLISLVKVDPANADRYIDAYNLQLARISESYSQLKLDTESDLNLALSEDGTTTLIRYENFYSLGGGRDYYNAKLAEALMTPNMNGDTQNLFLSAETILGEDLE